MKQSQSGTPHSDPQDLETLRDKRLRRYRKRRSMLRSNQLTATTTAHPSAPKAKPTSKTSPHKAAVLGVNQVKRSKKGARAETLLRQKRRTAKSDLQRLRNRKQSIGRQLIQLLFAGFGFAALAGGAIAIFHPETPLTPQAQNDSSDGTSSSSTSSTASVISAQQNPLQNSGITPVPPTNVAQPGRELRELRQELQNLITVQDGLKTGLFFMNPETGDYVSIEGNRTFPAASTIKLPILIAFFQSVDNGTIKLNDSLVMRPDLMASEAGSMQYDPPGTTYSALKTADWMITISDNTATNMLIDRLGGPAKLNQLFAEWGLTQTKINQPLPDLEGLNKMSPQDFAFLLAKLSQGKLLSAHSRDRALDILRNTVTQTLLPQGIEPDATIAHKTGDIGISVGDTGLIDMPNGQRYVASIMVERPHNDPRAQELIRNISRLTYQTYSKLAQVPTPSVQPPAKPTP